MILRWLFFVLIVGLAQLQATEYHYTYLPKKVFSTQIFPVTILASHARPATSVVFRFDPSGTQPIHKTPAKLLNGHDLFYTFYFKARGEDDIRIPPLLIVENNQTYMLDPHLIHTEQLESNASVGFCGLIAADCQLQSSQLSIFDANTTLVSITLRAHEANPEAIHIPGSIEEGVEKITRDKAVTTAEYYFVIPSSQKSIALSYYNTVQRRFVPTIIATDYRNKSVAAQVELNPKASPFDQLKKYGSIVLALFFALMFWWQRDWLYIILLVVVIVILVTVYRPRDRLCIREGSSLYVLPTHNSHSSTTITEELHTRSLGERGTYHKVNYHNGIIGWIRHEDLCQD